jgi:hypothetical protein
MTIVPVHIPLMRLRSEAWHAGEPRIFYLHLLYGAGSMEAVRFYEACEVCGVYVVCSGVPKYRRPSKGVPSTL